MNIFCNVKNKLNNLFVKEHSIITHWFDTNEKIRFMITGALNMGIRYLIFIILGITFTTMHYQLILLLMWLISSVIAFYAYKILVFETIGNHLKEYTKSIAIWGISYLINAGLLILLVEKLQLNLFLSEAIAIVLLIIINYLLFKYFAFRKENNIGLKQKIINTIHK